MDSITSWTAFVNFDMTWNFLDQGFFRDHVLLQEESVNKTIRYSVVAVSYTTTGRACAIGTPYDGYYLQILWYIGYLASRQTLAPSNGQFYHHDITTIIVCCNHIFFIDWCRFGETNISVHVPCKENAHSKTFICVASATTLQVPGTR